MYLRNFFFIILFTNVKGLLSDNENESRKDRLSVNYGYSDSLTLFTARFWRVAVKHLSKEQNLIFYPISFLRVLTWLQLGANTDSEVQIQGATLLVYDKWKTHLNLYENSLSETINHRMFSIGDGGYYDGGLRRYLKQAYKKELKESFKLDVTKLPPYDNPNLTASYLNEDVERITHNKVKKFFTSSMFGKRGNAMLFSGLHFKGNWDSAFNKQNTEEKEFQVNPKKKVKIPMMNLKTDLIITKNYKQMGFNLIEIPLEISRFKFLIIEPTGFSLEKIIEKLTGIEMIALLSNEGDYYKVNLTLPRLKLKGKKHDVSHYLIDNEIGIRDIFNEVKADFTNMTFKKEVLAKDISEASYFSMTETSIQTAGVVNAHLVGNYNKIKASKEDLDIESDEQEESTTLETPKLIVDINQPFMFILLDTKFRIPLVLGKISNPKL